MTAHGLQTYLDLGIPVEKMILGVPWYGYNYPCIAMDKVSSRNQCILYQTSENKIETIPVMVIYFDFLQVSLYFNTYTNIFPMHRTTRHAISKKFHSEVSIVVMLPAKSIHSVG